MSKDTKSILERISDKLPLATGKDRMIKLDKNNPDNVELYEGDEVLGK